MRYVQLIDYREFNLGKSAELIYVNLTLRTDKNRLVKFGLRSFANEIGLTFSALRCGLQQLTKAGLITTHSATHLATHSTTHSTAHFSCYKVLSFNEIKKAYDTPYDTLSDTPSDTLNDTFINNNNNNNNNISTHNNARVFDSISKAIAEVCNVDLSQAGQACEQWKKEMKILGKTWKNDKDMLQHAVRWSQRYVFTKNAQKVTEAEKTQQRANMEAEARKKANEAERQATADKVKAEVYARMLKIFPAPQGEDKTKWAERVLDAYYATHSQDRQVLTDYIISHYD